MTRKDLEGYLKTVPTTIPKYHMVPLQVGASTVLSIDYENQQPLISGVHGRTGGYHGCIITPTFPLQ